MLGRGAESPGLSVKLKTAAKSDAMPPPAASIWAVAVSNIAWAWQQVLGMTLLAASLVPVTWLISAIRQASAADSREAWSWEELGITEEIACGRTAHVFEGRINGQPVAVKVGGGLSPPCECSPACKGAAGCIYAVRNMD